MRWMMDRVYQETDVCRILWPNVDVDMDGC